MSFKREGEDYSSLNILQKRRVAELLSEEIPQDEAHLMKNGRYACMVCHHRPVFDTLTVLQHHRQGKKHKHYLEKWHENQQELEDLKQKRRQEQYLKTGDTGLLTGIALNHLGQAKGKRMLPQAVTYDPRVKKPKRHDRKAVLDLSEVPSATSTSTCDGMAHSSYAQAVKKPVFQKSDCSFEVKPYISNQQHRPNSVPPHSSSKSWLPKKATGQSPQTIAEYRKMQKFKSVKTNHVTVPYNSKRLPRPTATQIATGSNSIDSGQTLGFDHKAVFCVGHDGSSSKPSFSAKKHQVQNKSAGVDEARIHKARQYLDARCSGWKKDLSGAWVKDEDAEFDSDEEPPNLP